MHKDRYIAGNENGLTLIELLVSLLILCFVAAVTFQLFHITNHSWLQAKARSQSTRSATRAIQLIAHDIRSSQKPSALTRPVVVSAAVCPGDTIDIYRYNDNAVLLKYEQVRYRLNSGSLQRALVCNNHPINSVDWYAVTWDTIACNVCAGPAGVFADTSPLTASEDGRRRIAVSFQVSAPSAEGLVSPCIVDDIYTTRSQVIEGQIAGSSPGVRVTGISVSPSQQNNLDDDATSFDASVSIYPIDASNKSISTASPGWLHCSVSGLNIHVIIDAQPSNADARSGTITITSDDIYKRVTTITCKQKAESFF